MAIAGEPRTPYADVAMAVAERSSELLGARVLVVDQRGVVVAGGESSAIGLPVDAAIREQETVCLRMPVRLERQDSEVVVCEPASGEAISPRLAQALVELIVNQTTVVARLPNQRELKNKFIHDVLRGPVDDETAILREAQILGMDLTRPRAVILVDAGDYIQDARTDQTELRDARIRRRAQLVIASIVDYFKLPTDTICAYIGDGEIVVLKASSSQDLAAWTDQEDGSSQANASWADLVALKRASAGLLASLRRDTNTSINIGIGRYHPGVRGLARSYQDARAALSLGRRFHGHNKVHCLDGLGIAAFVGVADEQTKVELATHLLSPLDHEPELLDTLQVFFDSDCCPSATVARLKIHRNTLSYRLAKIASLTGLDPRRFDEAVQARLALVLRSLRVMADDAAGSNACA